MGHEALSIPVRERADFKRMISLPKALDQQMKKFPAVNWSAVARAAFIATLKELNTRKNGAAAR